MPVADASGSLGCGVSVFRRVPQATEKIVDRLRSSRYVCSADCGQSTVSPLKRTQMFFRRLFGCRHTTSPPPRLGVDAAISGDVSPTSPLGHLPLAELQSICDTFWQRLSASASNVRPEYDEYVHALNALAERDASIFDWVFERLDHPEYEAREQAAFLVSRLAHRDQIPTSQREPSVRRLRAMALRQWQEDPKEVQANSSAVFALSALGGDTAIATLREIVESKHWDEDDLSWDAACELGRLVGQPFAESEDPKMAARAWLSNPSGAAG